MWRVIFIAAIFISSFFPSTGDSTCPAGFRKYDSKCRELADPLRCVTATGNNDGDICVINTRYCSPTPLRGPIDASLIATPGCQEGFTLDTADGVCRKRIPSIIKTYCAFEFFSHGDNGVCRMKIALLQVCPDNSNVPTGCIPREYYTDRLTGNRKIDDCYQGYVADPEESKKCVFTPGAAESFCPDGFKLDTSINECLSKWNLLGKLHCYNGVVRDNECFATRPIKYTCSLGSGHFQDSTIARISCLHGNRSGGICQNTRDASPFLACPYGFGIPRDGKECESDDTINASPS